MKAFAIQGVDDADGQLKHDSLRIGKGRFGWGWSNEQNLLVIKNLPPVERTFIQQLAWDKASFLFDIEPGDWLVYINTPSWDYCSAVQVTGKYYWEENPQGMHEYRHIIPVDAHTVVDFYRRSASIMPSVCLRNDGRYWFIYNIGGLEASLERVKEVAHLYN